MAEEGGGEGMEKRVLRGNTLKLYAENCGMKEKEKEGMVESGFAFSCFERMRMFVEEDSNLLQLHESSNNSNPMTL
ncbi:hypothetical protein Csa_019480 [Cucumis sativus]|uniref:Uncharacterized protein n=1 Tax=Cucumis sativus TaxID=3659 RepID=A0A0A0LL34_CUCSA|nr:hypothetical protein Csa_019480 [Cucumis sativus]